MVRVATAAPPGSKLLVECLRRFTPRVAIMQTTEARHGSHHCAGCRLLLDSPWSVLFEGVVQSLFSCAKRRIRTRISSVILGRPPRGRDSQRQYRRKPAWCQATTVSGFTMTRTSVQRGQKWRKVVQTRRSREFNGGRGRLRLSTATCCQRARTSRAVSLRLRKKTRITARARG